MSKSNVHNWLLNIVYKNGLNKKQSLAFARNYTEDKTALKDITKRYNNHILKQEFEKNTINSLKLQLSLKFTKDNPFTNFKSTYCCNNFYNGNKKKCDICKNDLKF
tara:strand:- start:1920 stop:2237 length:318 start_codon:yes stop_codon:yes gene_type:complete